jgi:hypothetical protein
MYAIRFFIGFGKVRFHFSQEMVHFVVEDRASLLLANLLNGRFRTPAKYDAFVTWLAKLTKDNPIAPLPLNTEMDFNWLAGFTEGDGSFLFQSSQKAPCYLDLKFL